MTRLNQKLSLATLSGPEQNSDPNETLDRTALTLDHLWLADSNARRYHDRGESDEDLQQVARCALLEAAHRYDPAQGPFIPYAGPTISGVLKRHFRDHGWVVRPPRDTQQVAVRISQQWSDIAQDCGTVPSDQDLAAHLDESVDAVREAQHASQGYRTVPLDSADAPIARAASEDPGFEQCETRLMVAHIWQLVGQQDRQLLWMRFWEHRSQSDIAALMGISQMQVSRLLARLLKRLRDQLAEEYLAAELNA